jgi:hypothetical protein
VADAIKAAFEDINEVELISGRRGEFTVWLGKKLLAKKSMRGFPTPEQVITALRAVKAADHP